MSTKKFFSAALTATTLVWSLGIAVLPASAQTTADLQAQIAALLAQIQQLQGQLNAGHTGTTTSFNFTRDLTVGSKGDDVSALQQTLINGGYLTAVTAPTGFFGSATKAALAKWQAAKGIAPAAGFFGPKTRAAFAASGVGTTGGGTTPGTGSTGGGVTAPASGLAVSVAPGNPIAGSLISGTGGGSGAARVPVFAVNFTAGNSGAVTLSELKFHKTGVLADNSIAGAYIVQNGKVLAQYNSLNQGVIDFSGMSLQIPAGQTQTLWLAIDVAGGLSAGNTTGFSLPGASDVVAWDLNNTAVTPSGAFPLLGNIFTVTTVQNPSLATLSIASSSIGNQVTAGTQGNLVGAWNFTVTNSKVSLKGLNFKVIGSANRSDIRNVKLMVNGTQVGSTLAAVGADGSAFFDTSANPGVLNTGSNNVQIFADVMGSPSYNFQFEILNGYDIYAVDSQYNVPVSSNSNSGTQVSIQQGQITVTQDAATPTGNIAKGQSQIALAKFDVYAAGEAVRVKFLDFTLTLNGQGTGALSTQIQNVSLVDDAGGQVGTTINTPPSVTACAAGTAAYSTSTGIYTDCFGTSASPINYVIPANTTRVLTLKADIQSTASFSTITGSLTGNTNNLQGLTSSQLNSSSGAAGSALTLASSSLTVAANNALGNQNISAGVVNQKVGSYSFTAASAEGVNVNNVSVQLSPNATSTYFQNLKVMIGGAQFGTTQGVVNFGTIYTFSGNPFNVPAGGTVNVDVYADTLSTAPAGTVAPATKLTGCSASGQISFTAISCSAVTGQSVTFAGTASITASADAAQPPARQIVMGAPGNTLAVYNFAETSNVENVKVTDLTVNDFTQSGSKAAFSNLSMWNGAQLLGTAGSAIASVASTTGSATITVGTSTTATSTSAGNVAVVINGFTVSAPILIASTTVDTATAIATAINASTTVLGGVTATSTTNVVTLTYSGNATLSVATPQLGLSFATTGASFGTGYTYLFHFATPILVPQANSVSVTLKGDAASFSSAGATDNSTHQFVIATTKDITALGNTSNKTATPSISSAKGNVNTVLRTVLTPSINNSSADGTYFIPSNHQSRNATDDLAEVKFTADAAGGAVLTKLIATFSGSLASSTTFLDGVKLLDSDGTSIVTDGATVATSTACTATNTCTVTWTIPTSTTKARISAGATGLFKLRINDQAGQAAVANTAMSLSVTIQAATDVNYVDSLDASGISITSIPTSLVPITISSFALPLGN